MGLTTNVKTSIVIPFNRVAVGMGMGIVVILWEFPRGNPVGIPTWECCGNPMGILLEFLRGNSIRDLIRYPFDFECLHNDAINIYTFLCNYNINHSPPAPR